jgi:hypothetical protein
VPLREAEIGSARIREASPCIIPASRATIHEASEIVGSIVFG